MGLMTVQHNSDQLQPVALHTGHKGVARQGGVARLAAENAGIIHTRILFHHLVAAVDSEGLFVRGIGPHFVVSCGIELHKDRILKGCFGDQGEIISRGVVVRIVQTGGIREMGIRAAKLRSLLVHKHSEFFDTAGAVLRQRVGHLVGGF